MKTFPTRFCLALALATGSLAANAATFYFSDCQAGADPACVPGDNRNGGTSPSSPKRDLVGFNVKGQGAGEHTLRFARGAAWLIHGRPYLGSMKTVDQSLVFTDYQPAWGSGSALPLIKFAASTHPDTLGAAGFGLVKAGSGYTFRNLDLSGEGQPGGPAYSGSAFFFYGKVSNVLIENVTMRNFSMGLYLAQQKPSSTERIENVTVRDSRIVSNHAQGMLGGGYNVVFENNLFENNGFKGGPRYHNIYLSEYGENMVLRGNTLRGSALVDGRCTGVSLVGHDHLVKTLIENNTIVERRAKWGCYGIQINGYQSSTKYMGFDGTIIRGNTVVMGEQASVGIGVNACPDCVIENNVVVGLGTVDFTAINVPDGSFTSAGSRDDAITVRNNSVYIDSPTGNTFGIRVNAPGATDDRVLSNLVYFGPGSHADAKCFKTGGRSLASYAAFENNLCFRAGGPSKWSDQHATLAAAQAAGWDEGSLAIDPLLAAVPSAANRWSMQLRAGSPAINTGSRVMSATSDVLRQLRDALPDMGAFESGNRARPAPAAPSGVVVQ